MGVFLGLAPALIRSEESRNMVGAEVIEFVEGLAIVRAQLVCGGLFAMAGLAKGILDSDPPFCDSLQHARDDIWFRSGV